MTHACKFSFTNYNYVVLWEYRNVGPSSWALAVTLNCGLRYPILRANWLNICPCDCGLFWIQWTWVNFCSTQFVSLIDQSNFSQWNGSAMIMIWKLGSCWDKNKGGWGDYSIRGIPSAIVECDLSFYVWGHLNTFSGGLDGCLKRDFSFC